MAIPTFEEIMLPLLKLLSDQNIYLISEIRESLELYFKLTDEEKNRILPSGTQTYFSNRVHWAKTYLLKASLIESPQRGSIKISQLGLDILKENPKEINPKFLERFPTFNEFIHRGRAKNKDVNKSPSFEEEKTPREIMESVYENLRFDLMADLLSNIKNCSPKFFENLVVDLILKIGYGGSRLDAGKAIGRTGDGGIDGIIKEDKLGLDAIYIQAKRWEGTVGRPEIQKFIGALLGQKAKKGIFITTSRFSPDAKEYVKGIDSRVILIDGEELANLMIDYDIGVSKIVEYELKKIDLDYFIEE